MTEVLPSPFLLHEDHAVQVFYQPRRADHLVITFSEMTMTADRRRYWGQGPLQRLGIPALGFVHKRRRWFADDFMRRSIAATLSVIEPHGQRITCGFSMGAYGAIRQAARLGASTAVMHVLAKPFTMEALASRIEDLIGIEAVEA